MKKLLIFLVLFSFAVKADEYLIGEMEKLRDSLSIDDPARIELTLRLADLYFDTSIKEGDADNQKKLNQQRLRALDLYKDPLYGRNGIPKATGVNRIKIEFQMARLLTRLNEQDEAEAHYLNVYHNQKAPKKIKEQSSLALAEYYEQTTQFKKANSFYQKSLALCEDIPTCNYAHYRRAWLLYKDTKLDQAIGEIEKTLWDKNKNIRENVLLDYIMFLSNKMSNGFAEYKKIEKLAKKLNRPKLLRDITEAFYVAGNRKAGTNLLDIINRKEPNIYYEIRLLEEFYGFRKWEKVEYYLSALEKRKRIQLPKNKEDAKETKKIIRRLLVQLDSEAQVVTDLNPYLLRTIDIYLTMYPNDDLRKNMQQGWLNAQSDAIAKINRLEKWIHEDVKFGFSDKEIRKLRQTRLALAQDHNKSKIIIDEALAIAKILEGSTEAREFNYVAAHEMYKTDQNTKALPLFNDLVNWNISSKTMDKWGLLSQNLMLDIYNEQKQYDKLMSQVDSWLAVHELTKAIKAQDDIKLMQKVRTEARFEHAIALGDTPKALNEFMYFCQNKIYTEKACANAKVLAVRLKDQKRLVWLLENEGDEKALLVEYEMMGEFNKAAKLYEKLHLKRKSDIGVYLKNALLYELALNFKDRNRILDKLTTKLKRDKSIPKEYEPVIFNTLDQANMINHASLSLPWSTSRKISLAHRLETQKSNSQTRKLIMAQKESVGPVWGRLVLERLQKKFKRIGKLGFYGRGSKWKFKRRTKAMEKFSKTAKSYLDGADTETRVYILDMLKLTYQNLAIELYQTPMPEGLDADTIQQVMTQLSQMAAPFEKVAKDYERLQNEQIAELKENKQQVIANLESANANYATFIHVEKFKKQDIYQQWDKDQYLSLLNDLKANPESLLSIKQIHQYLKESNNERLSAYFAGRLNDLQSTTEEL